MVCKLLAKIRGSQYPISFKRLVQCPPTLKQRVEKLPRKFRDNILKNKVWKYSRTINTNLLGKIVKRNNLNSEQKKQIHSWLTTLDYSVQIARLDLEENRKLNGDTDSNLETFEANISSQALEELHRLGSNRSDY
jgi:hypothetical protein